MNPDEPVQQVQRAATVQDIVNDHIGGQVDPETGKVQGPLSGYEIAAKYGLDTEVVKRIISEADQRLAFVPPDENGNKEAPVDAVVEPLVQPLPEGENPEAMSTKGHK